MNQADERNTTVLWEEIVASGEGFTNEQLYEVIDREPELREKAGELLLRQDATAVQLELVAKHVPSLRDAAVKQLLAQNLPAKVLTRLYGDIETYRGEIFDVLQRQDLRVMDLMNLLHAEQSSEHRASLWAKIEQQLDATPAEKLNAPKAVENGMTRIVVAEGDALSSKAWQRLLSQPDNVSGLLKVYKNSEQFRSAAGAAIGETLRSNKVASYLDFAAILESVPEVRDEAWEALSRFGEGKDVLTQLLCHSDFNEKDRAWQELQKIDLSPAALLDLAEHAPRPYRDEAWKLFKASSPSISSIQHVLEGCDDSYISERLWKFCFNDNRSSDEMCAALTCVPHNNTAAAQEILKRNPTNRALTVVMQFAPEVSTEAWEPLKQHGPAEVDLLRVSQLGGNTVIAEEAGQMLEKMRSPAKREFLKRLEM